MYYESILWLNKNICHTNFNKMNYNYGNLKKWIKINSSKKKGGQKWKKMYF